MEFSKLKIFYFCLIFLAFSVYLVNCDGSEEKESESDLENPVVELGRQGKLQGLSLISRRGRKYYGFLGIPYGKVSERFAVSEPADGWDGIRDAQTLPPACFQFLVFIQQMYGVEDCLMLNVYSPKLDEKKKLPVLVWFYPGGFQIGGASMCEAKYLMDQDVVFVTLNYRLGAMGFLNTGDGEVSGNMGLKDQNLALKWVQENIAKFGGDPNMVTIFGLSAGGASVDYHLLSPMSKGLFHRAISQSGSVLNPWAFTADPKALYKQLAKNAECVRDTSEETVKCLKEKDPADLMKAQLKFSKYGFEFDIISMKFIPSVETPEVKGERFLSESPYNLLKRGDIVNKVPYVSSITENEGSFYIAPLMTKPESVSKLNKQWNEMAPNIFLYEDSIPSNKADQVSQKLRNFYFGKKEVSEETRRNISNIFSDRLFANGIVKSIKLHAKHQQVYPLYINYQGKYSGIQFDFEGVKERDGFAHADDLFYMFNATLGTPELELGTPDAEFSEKYVKFLASFAKDGKPTGAWAPVKELKPVKIESPDKPEETKIKFYQLDMKTDLIDDPFTKRREFWDTLPLEEHEKSQLVPNKDEL